MITLEDARKQNEIAWKTYNDALTTIKTFDEEESRGLVHKKEYEEMISNLRKNLSDLLKISDQTYAQHLALLPPYDPHNHTNSCGCIVKDGARVYWCGDHY